MKTQQYVSGVFLSLLISASTASAGIGLTYHGRIMKPDGSALESASVQFTVQIRSPGNESCLLYQESQNIDMSGSAGVFSLELGANPGYRVAASVDGGNTISKVFANQGTLTLPTCAFGSTYTPNSADGRLLYISFNDGSGAQTLSAQKITYVPYAIESMQVNGYSASQLVRVDSGTAPVLTPANLTMLSQLFGGTLAMNTTGNVTTTGTVSGADIQATNLKVYNGANYVQLSAPTLSSNVLFKLPAADGTNNQVLKTDGAGNLAWTSMSAGNLTDTLANGKIWIGNASGVAAETAISGDISLANTGAVSVTKIRGVGVNVAAPSAAGQTLRYDGSSEWAPAFLSLADIRSTITPFGGAFANANCTAAQSLYYEAASDSFKCQSISLSSYVGNVDIKGELRLSGATSGYAGFKPAAAAGSTVWILPTADGTNGQVLSTNGSGVLSWASSGGSGDFKSDGTVQMTAAIRAADGAWNAPSIRFASSASTGFYNAGGMIGLSANGNLVGTISATSIALNGSYGPWIRLGTGASNTPNTPTYSFSGDNDSGLFSPTANSIGLAAGAVEVLRGESSGKVGIMTGAPLALLHLREADDSWTSSFRMDRSWDSTTDYFQMMYDYEGLKIRTVNDADGDGAHIIFKPKDSEALRISETGNVGIGTTNPGAKLQVNSSIALEENSNNMNGSTISFWKNRNYAATQINDQFGSLSFYGHDGTTTRRGAQILASADIAPTAGSVPSSLIFLTTNSGDADVVERMRISSNGHVGIGTTVPGYPLVVEDAAAPNGTNTNLARFHGGSDATLKALGISFWVSPSATATDRYAGIGVGDFTGARNLILGMNSNGAQGNVGIGTTTPGHMFDVNGLTANVSGAWVVRSDARLKRDIATLENPLDTILNLHGVSFRWKDAEKDQKFGLQRGFIAQEVEKVVPEWVHEGSDGYKRIEKTGIEAYFVEAIKELYNKWLSDHERIAELEKRNQELTAAICEVNSQNKICKR
ncbi:tail fiber domain-containing protein [Bdellovibrio sp. HCB337]|uniref:tail fiber domain-containing protein n=1 Tax=Bdellovibrio sp. HCB337 TaxID=3394358 RepID=UPI0039A76721